MAAAAADAEGLHKAARSGNVGLVRFLLERKHNDPNCLDNSGLPPLFAACQSVPANVEVVRLLLQAGADPSLTDDQGALPLHIMVFRGHLDLVDMLYSAAPATLNRTAANGQTALYVACCQGYARMVYNLISLGAMEPTPKPFACPCPLAEAVMYGFLDIVRMLTTEVGVRAVGGGVALPKALHNAVVYNQARSLQLLLTVGGDTWGSEWANITVQGRSLLYVGAAYCCPAAVSILLEAGANEAVEDPDGLTPRDVVGHAFVLNQSWEEVAIRWMLERGPAYRARSWAWPLRDKQADDGSDGRNFDSSATATAADFAAADILLSFGAAMAAPVSSWIGILRPREKNSLSKYFLPIICRYCAKV